MDAMLKILIITYHFPPDGAIGGVRPYRLARHLPDSGIEAWVLTVEPQFAELYNPELRAVGVADARVFRTDVAPTLRDHVLNVWRRMAPRRSSGGVPEDEGHRRLPTAREWVLSWLAFPDRYYGWYRPAVLRGETAIREIGFDVLVATSPPRVGPLIASELSRKRRIPWVMDLRDPWQMHWKGSDSTPRLVQLLLGRLFKRCVQSSSLIIHNTERLRQLTCGLVPSAVAKTACVPNGFEPEWVESGEEVRSRHLTIGYYGNIMGNRSATPFLGGLRLWLDGKGEEAPIVAVRFVGSGLDDVRTRAEALGLDDVVSTLPPVPRSDIPRLMREDFVLLLLANDQPLQVPGKAYDYLATGRRILALADRDGATAELLEGLEGCAVVQQPGEVALALEAFNRAFEQRSSASIGRKAFLADAQYPRRIASFAKLLHSIGER